jgi:pyruvate/2-oxoglutarate dehydrogenase complex dihydrolipoamide acyltransferase (E2) component
MNKPTVSREYVKLFWMGEHLSELDVQRLGNLADQLKLDASSAAAIEREVMGASKEEILDRELAEKTKGQGEPASQAADNLQQQIEQETMQSAQDFFGYSMGDIKAKFQSDRAQLEEYASQLPEDDAQARIQEMIDSYAEFEYIIDQAAQDIGVEDTLNQVAQDTQQRIMQDTQGAAQQAEDPAIQVYQQGGQQVPNATQAAQQKAQELGVDLSQVQGSGAEGRITVRDVMGAANPPSWGVSRSSERRRWWQKWLE